MTEEQILAMIQRLKDHTKHCTRWEDVPVTEIIVALEQLMGLEDSGV